MGSNNKYNKKYYKECMKDPVFAETRRIRNRKARYRFIYGISEEIRDRMFIKQKGLCFICYKPMKKPHSCAVDHNHKTGKVRKLLCKYCNTGLGYLENKLFYKKAKSYLKYENRKTSK